MTGRGSPLVVQHSLLESRGGAARVADMLAAGLPGLGWRCRRTFEMAETQEGADALAREPSEIRLARAVESGAILHLHSSLDWPGLLGGLRGAPLVVHLHDCRLFTGGCPFPVDCREHERGCPDPCPRGHAGSRALAEASLAAVEDAAPTLVAPSRWMAKLAGGVLERPVEVVPNGVEWPDERPSRAKARHALGIAERARVALFAAHGAEKAGFKGGERWRGVWERIAGELPDVLCLMAGGGESGREGRLLRFPYLDQPKLRLVMAAADLLLYPTLADNHPLIILEAMASATPTLAFAVGGIPEQIEPGETGFLARPGDWKALGRIAVELLGSRHSLTEAGARAFTSGRERFSLAAMASAQDIILRRKI
ncbi:glycosyltransferase [Desulfohalovibrio reitneri]|uniref:glycosyltransferase n=1 Tax=Desulfohalovibrio reitneri TaxID=1307759 RepID=UPI00068A35F2|nr:glycosyltransferase [Desulfohalovibrio reitneri]